MTAGWTVNREYGTLRWEPDDRQAALDALVAVNGSGVSSEKDIPDGGLVDLTDQPDVRTAVREEYDRLMANTTGGSASGQ